MASLVDEVRRRPIVVFGAAAAGVAAVALLRSSSAPAAAPQDSAPDPDVGLTNLSNMNLQDELTAALNNIGVDQLLGGGGGGGGSGDVGAIGGDPVPSPTPTPDPIALPPAPLDCGPMPLYAQPPGTVRVCRAGAWHDDPIPGWTSAPAPGPVPVPAPAPAPGGVATPVAAPAPAPVLAPAYNHTARCNSVRLRSGPHLSSAVLATVNIGARAHSIGSVVGDAYAPSSSAPCGSAGRTWLRLDYVNGRRYATPIYSAAGLWS